MAAVFTMTGEASLLGGFKIVIGTLAMDSSYPTDGEAVDLSTYFPGGSVLACVSDPTSSGGYLIGHAGTASAGKFLAYWFDYDAGADGAAIQVANTTDLSGVTAARCVLLGN